MPGSSNKLDFNSLGRVKLNYRSNIAFLKAKIGYISFEYNSIEFFNVHSLILWIGCYEARRILTVEYNPNGVNAKFTSSRASDSTAHHIFGAKVRCFEGHGISVQERTDITRKDFRVVFFVSLRTEKGGLISSDRVGWR